MQQVLRVVIAACVLTGCAADIGSGRTEVIGSSATPELEVGLSALEGDIEQNRRNRIAIFEGNALASRVFEGAMNSELRALGLDTLTYVDYPMTLTDAPMGEIIGVELASTVDPVAPAGIPAGVACAFAMPAPPIDTSGISCRFMVSNATDRARVRASQAAVEEPLYDEFADEAPRPEEVREWYARAMAFGVENSIPHALESLRAVGACDREPSVAESAFERGVAVGRRVAMAAIRTEEGITAQTECDVDRIVRRGTAGLDSSTLTIDNPLCAGFEAASTDASTYLAAATRELTAGIAAGITEASREEEARLVRTWVCEIPPPDDGGGEGGGGGGGGSGDPLVLDLDGNGVHIEPLVTGAFFDFGDTGRVHTEWLARGDGFLVFDRDRDGEIVSTELFGDVTETEDGSGAGDGLEALALYDAEERGGNADGRIDGDDAVFAELSVWIDRDGDARADEGELVSLSSLGITAIEHQFERFITDDGEGLAVDVWFSYQN